MSKIRVYEIAKQVGVSNKDLVDELTKLGIEVKNHMGSLSDEEVTKILGHYKNKGTDKNQVDKKSVDNKVEEKKIEKKNTSQAEQSHIVKKVQEEPKQQTTQQPRQQTTQQPRQQTTQQPRQQTTQQPR
ncbi:MAG: hypothetical protein CVV02_09560, partial [Firmicutes bacterium HGW-Firmicutes-7]